MNRAIVQATVGTCPTIDVSRPFAEAYANRVGADYIYLDRTDYVEKYSDVHLYKEPFRNERVSIMFAAKSCLDFIAEKYEQTLWVDTDVVISPKAPSIFFHVPEKSFGAWCGEYQFRSSNATGPEYQHGYFNAGVMVLPFMAHGIVGKAFSYCQNPEMLTDTERRHLVYDQTPLNKALAKSQLSITPLSLKWNHCISSTAKKANTPSFESAYFWHFAASRNTPIEGRNLRKVMDQEARAGYMADWLKERNIHA